MEDFIIKITNENMDQVQQLMDRVWDETNKYIEKLAEKLNITRECAMDVYYLRTRSRWTEELEKELINLHRNGNAPDICDWP